MLFMISLQNSIAFAKNCSNSKLKKIPNLSIHISLQDLRAFITIFQVYLRSLITLISAGQVALHTLQIQMS